MTTFVCRRPVLGIRGGGRESSAFGGFHNQQYKAQADQVIKFEVIFFYIIIIYENTSFLVIFKIKVMYNTGYSK